MIRSVFLLLSGNAVTWLMLLARNLLIARLIPVADYGIAATFSIAVAVIEMVSQLGLQQQIVQSKDGDNPRFQAALQGFQVLRGGIAAVILFVSAGAIAAFLGVPEVAWAYQVMAAWPLLNALQHFDIHRLNRQMRFRPVVLTGAMPALISLAAVWPLYLAFGDYRVMLWAIVVQIGLMCAVSHLVAERPYRLVFDHRIMAESLRFGWPLLINGALMFAVFQGDKLIVGRELGIEALAVFAMGVTLTLTPTLVMASAAQKFFLPQLSAVDPAAPGGADRFQRLATATMQTGLLSGVLPLVVTSLFGASLVLVLFGDKYADLLPLLFWMAVMQAMRVAKSGPSIVSVSLGHTSYSMISSAPRVLTLPLSWYVATTTGDLLAIIWIATVGELAGHLVLLLLLRWKAGIPLRRTALAHAGAFAMLPLSYLITTGGTAPLHWAPIAILLACTLVFFWSCRELRIHIVGTARSEEIGG